LLGPCLPQVFDGLSWQEPLRNQEGHAKRIASFRRSFVL
jgi:hypothetical protein